MIGLWKRGSDSYKFSWTPKYLRTLTAVLVSVHNFIKRLLHLQKIGFDFKFYTIHEFHTAKRYVRRQRGKNFCW